jgi:hypothetical protein
MEWILIWKYVLIVGILLFVGITIYIIPTGIRDVMRFFKSLDDKE